MSNQPEQDGSEISTEVLGIVHDEHYRPGRRRQPIATVAAERREFPDRTFYMLITREGGDYCGIDLDRTGWKTLQALCGTVLESMDQEQAE